jgi:hypothetical protein
MDSTPQAMTMSQAPAITPWAAKWAACGLEPHRGLPWPEGARMTSTMTAVIMAPRDSLADSLI